MAIARFEKPITTKFGGTVVRDDYTSGAYALRIDQLERYEIIIRLLAIIFEVLWPVRPRLPQVRISWQLPKLPIETRRKVGIVSIWSKHYFSLGRLP